MSLLSQEDDQSDIAELLEEQDDGEDDGEEVRGYGLEKEEALQTTEEQLEEIFGKPIDPGGDLRQLFSTSRANKGHKAISKGRAPIKDQLANMHDLIPKLS